MLSQDTCLFIARWFLQGHYDLGIPGPGEGKSLLNHIVGMKKMVKEFKELNPGADSLPEMKEIALYIAALESIVGDLVVLQAIPISAAMRLVQKGGAGEE